MNGHFSSLPVTDRRNSAAVEMASSSSGGVNLDKLTDDVESVKEELSALEAIRQRLLACHENSKSLSDAKAVKDLRRRMDGDVAAALKKAKVVKVRLEALDRSNGANRGVPGCGPGSSSDRTRTSVVNGLRKNLRDTMESFNELREKISSEFRETVQGRYFALTGVNPDELTLDRFISTGKSETFLQKAIQQQGRKHVFLDTIQEMQERHDAIKDIQKNLMELHQVFLDMGDQVNDTEGKVNGAHSFVKVKPTTGELHQAKKQRSGIWGCCVLFLNCASMCVQVCAACA